MRKKWKIQKRWEIKEGVLIQVELEEDSSLLHFGRPKGSPLWRQGCPLPPPLYTRGLGLFETQLCHVLPSPLDRSSSSRSVFCGARAEPCRNRSPPPPERRHAAGELIYFRAPLAGSRRQRSSSSCTCAENEGAVRSVLDRDGSWDGDDLDREDVPLHQPCFLTLPA